MITNLCVIAILNSRFPTPFASPPTYLVDLMCDFHFRLLLPAGTITHPTENDPSGTTIDLVWGNENAEDIMLKYQTTSTTNNHSSDHLAIEIVLDLQPKTPPTMLPPYNYTK